MTLLEKLNELITNEATAEDIQSSLGEFMIPKGTFNKINDENKALKTKVMGLETEVTGLNEQVETVKTANMDEQELLLHKLEQAELSIKNNAMEKNKLSAENDFITAGFSKEEYQGLLEQVVSDDSEKTQSLVQSFLTLASSNAKKATDNEVDRLLDQNNKLPKGDKLPEGTDVSVDQFKNFTVTERTELFNENQELYNTLNTEAKAQ